MFDDNSIRAMILELYRNIGFKGLSLNEMVERISGADRIGVDRIKSNIGYLISAGELEYVDYRCYRVYGRFEDYLKECPKMDERNRSFVDRKLQGETLETIAGDYNLTRQRAQQVIKKSVKKVHDYYSGKTGLPVFDEDYYKYLYKTYFFSKEDGEKWLGVTGRIQNYLQLTDTKQGTHSLEDAIEDRNLEAGMRQKIRNYLNRNSVYVDNTWIPKKHHDLEIVVLSKFCRNKVTFDEFVSIYNKFLEDEEIPYDESIYITEANEWTRKEHLRISRYVLWNWNESLRYYDIDNRDYKDLLAELGLMRYRNTEVSTLKFIENHPELMEYYDIRDQYELHNLIKKTVPEGGLNVFHAGKMPTLRFGEFDRDAAILEVIKENSPISTSDLVDEIHRIYGYDKTAIAWSMLAPFTKYCHENIYSIDVSQMSDEHLKQLEALLTEDFYYLSDIKILYEQNVSDADVDEVKPYLFKDMGFSVRSCYIYRGFSTVDEYIENALLSEDVFDLSKYREKFSEIQSYYYKITDLKKNLDLIEYEPDQMINIRKLEKSGITKSDLYDFRDSVFEFVEDGEFFNPKVLKSRGFESPLFELGFDDLFYSNILAGDDRFSSGRVYGSMILYKGLMDITISSFVFACVYKHRVVDAIDLTNELVDTYGCDVPKKFYIIYKAQEGGAFYDKILDRLYASEELYYSELDKIESA